MNDERARSRVVLLGQTRTCAHSVSSVLKKRSILPFQRGVRGGMRMWRGGGAGGGGGGGGGGWDEDVAGAELGERVGELVAGRVAAGVVAHHGLDGPAALLCHPRGGAPQR